MASLIIPPLPTTERGQACPLKVDPTGKMWIYCAGNNIIVRGIESASDTFIYDGHALQKTTCAAFSPNGNWVASADVTGTIKIWSPKGERVTKSEFRVWNGAVLDLAWSPDSQRIIACGDGKEIKAKAFLFDTGNAVGEITGHSKRVNSCTFRPTRPFRAATGGEDFIVCFHEGPPFKFVKSMNNHTNFVNSVRYSPDGETLASGGSDSKIHLYEGKTGEYESSFSGTSGSIWGLDWSSTDSQLGCVSGDKFLRVFAKGEEKAKEEFKLGDKLEDMPLGVCWGAGPLTAVCLDSRLVYLKDGKLVTLNGTQGVLSSCAKLESGGFVAGSADGSLVRIRDGETTPSARLKMDKRIVQIITSSTRPEVAVLTADEKIHFIDMKEEEPKILATHPLGGFAVCGSYQKDEVVILTKKNNLVSMKLTGQSSVRELKRATLCSTTSDEPTNDAHLAVAYEGMGNEMTIQTAPRMIEIYDEKGNAVHSIDAHKADVTVMAFSPNGRYLATCDVDRKVYVWNCATWEQAAMFSNHTSKITCASWHSDSNLLATGSLDRSVYIWNIATPAERVQKQNSHKEGVNGVAWCNNNKLASIGADGSFKLW